MPTGVLCLGLLWGDGRFKLRSLSPEGVAGLEVIFILGAPLVAGCVLVSGTTSLVDCGSTLEGVCSVAAGPSSLLAGCAPVPEGLSLVKGFGSGLELAAPFAAVDRDPSFARRLLRI